MGIPKVGDLVRDSRFADEAGKVEEVHRSGLIAVRFNYERGTLRLMSGNVAEVVEDCECCEGTGWRTKDEAATERHPQSRYPRKGGE